MSLKAARGTKRVCQNCGSKFYDLSRDPITCPICQAIYQQDARQKVAPAGNAADIDDDDDAISPAAADVELVSLDEVAEAESDVPDIEDDAVVEIEDDEADLKDADETFIEDEDDDGGDVSGLLGGAREEDDEV